VKYLLLAAAVALTLGAALAACSDMFSPPELPDLLKTPYDFAVVLPPFGMPDMKGPPPHDLSGGTTD
jgi:hypothetical protein